jgi:PAS domain-containing protein
MKKDLIEHPPVGFFSLKIDSDGELREIKEGHALWATLGQADIKNANQLAYFSSLLRQSSRRSISAFMVDLRSKAHDYISGYFTFGNVQKFLKFDFVLGDAAGSMHTVFGSVIDLTEIGDVSRHYQEVLDASQAYTWHLDLAKDEVAFGPSFSQHSMYGPGKLSISLADWRSILHPDDVAHTIDALSDLRTGKKRKVVVQYRRLDKSRNWIWLRVHAGVSRYDFDGKPVEIKGISFNITSHRDGGEAKPI